MALFEVHRDEFSGLQEFNSHLSQLWTEAIENDLYVIVGLSQFNEAEFIRILEREGFSTTDLGEITRIDKPFVDSNGNEGEASFYLHYDDSEHSGGVALFYTDQRKTEEIEGTIIPILEDSSGLYYLNVSPSLFRSIRQELIAQDESSRIIEFVAHRSKDSDYPCRIRPEVTRTINYYGDDGFQALEELEQNYGVRPRYLKFDVPNRARFKITRKGVFTLISGSLDVLFDYVEFCVQKALEVKREYDASSFEMLPTTETLQVPSSEPADIRLSGQLNFSQVSEIQDHMESTDWVFVNTFKQEGSVYFSGEVYDQQKRERFRMKATDERIRVFPQEEEGGLGSFLRFYEFVQNHVDPEASVDHEQRAGSLS